MSKDMDRDPDQGPQYADWMPDEAVRNLTMERALHGHETHSQLAKRLLDENLPMAVMSIVHMALQSPDERIRLASSRLVLESTIGTQTKGQTSDLPDGKEPWTFVYDNVLVSRKDRS